MHVDALTRLLDETRGDTVIAGHSMGAILALAVYARRPSRVSRIILIGLPYFPTRDAACTYLARQSLMNRLTLEWSWMAQGMCYMKDFFALPAFAPLARMPVDLYRDYWKHTWNSVSRSIFNTLLAADVVGLIREVEPARITLVHGRGDSVAPVEHIRQLVAQFPELRLREINSGHHPYLVYPRLLNRIIAGEEAQLTCDSRRS
jgi:pimeloyl-ACP methyl ester carboxylesterase